MEQHRKVARRTDTPKDTRHSWSLIDWMLAKLPILPCHDLDQVVDEVVQNWQQHAPRGQTHRPPPNDHIQDW